MTNVIVFDGPKGPPLIPKRGIQKYADSIEDFAGFLVICEPTNQLFFRLGSWDRFMIPLPFFRFKLTLKKIENFSTKQLEKEAKEAYGS